MFTLRLLPALFLILCTAPAAAQVVDWAATDRNVQLELIPQKADVKPGDTLDVAIRQRMRPHWHTYWINPGDSGEPMRIEWTAREGVEVLETRWPTPKKIPYGPLVNYGYEDEAIIVQTIKLPETLSKPLVLEAKSTTLVCMDICIPEHDTLTLDISAISAAAYKDLEIDFPRLPDEGLLQTITREGEDIVLNLGVGENPSLSEAHFFPFEWGVVDNAAPSTYEQQGAQFTLRQKAGNRDFNKIPHFGGVLSFKDDVQGDYALIISPEYVPAAPPSSEGREDGSAHGGGLKTTFLTAAILAFLGGIILNFMPCVFPILSIKALSLMHFHEQHPRQANRHGLAYTGGILTCFLGLAVILIALKAAGAEIGWGFQLQNPYVVLVLAYLMFIIGLNLAGLFDLSGRFASAGQAYADQKNLLGSYATGLLAVLVATPCTAPFMGVALGYALVAPALVTLGVFAALGLGLAAPFLLLAFVPATRKILPKPGHWMETFRNLLAFPMFAAAAWLIWVAGNQAGGIDLVLAVLLALTMLTLAIRILKAHPVSTLGKAIKLVSALGFLGLASVPFVLLPHMNAPSLHVQDEMSIPYSEDALNEALSSGKPVFVEMTADWCVTCKLNHRVAINTERTRAAFEANDVVYLLGDWTNEDPAITQYLERFDRQGVPLYVYYAPSLQGVRPAPRLLPQLLPPSIVADLFENP